MKHTLILIWLGLAVLTQAQITPDQLKKDVYFLASKKMKGRGTGTKQEQLAAKFIAKRFAAIGLEPKGTNGYLQTFSFKKSTNPHAAEGTEGKERSLTNVVGYLDNKAATTVVIGAHYDHQGLGHDGNSTMQNPEGKIHYGADDNASGTAGILALAKHYATNNVTEPVNFVFIAFSGEELGLLGSKKFTENSPVPINTISFMVNYDMIGRLDPTKNTLIVGGVGTSPAIGPVLDSVAAPFKLFKDSTGMGPSDHASFYLKDIPVLFFFTGIHTDYHKETDTPEKLNYTAQAEVLNYSINVIDALTRKPKLPFTATKQKASDTPAFKVTLGVIPDYAYDGQGLRLDGVSEGKPAQAAGLQKGDVITKLGDVDVTDIQTYMKALAQFKKGDKTTVLFIRLNQLITKEIEFK